MTTINYFGRADRNANATPSPTGTAFNFRLTLRQRATVAFTPGFILQLRSFNAGGFSEITPIIGNEYFASTPSAPPQMGQGQTSVTFGPYVVRNNPKSNGVAVALPHDLLATVWVPIDLDDANGEQESRGHVLSVVPANGLLRANVGDHQVQEFEGSSNSHDYHEALDAAIAAAKNGLQSTLVEWRIVDTSGTDGGFAQVHSLVIRIAAWLP